MHKSQEPKTVAVDELQMGIDIDYSKAHLNRGSFEQAVKMATFLTRATFIPSEFKNNPANCLIALQMASTLKIQPIEVMKGIYVLNGRPSFYSQFAISLANIRGPFSTRISFKTTGEGHEMSVTAQATLSDSSKQVSATASFTMAEKEGWTRNKKYFSMTEQMLSYKAAQFLIRKTCPEILMGLQFSDELVDIQSGQKTAMNSAVESINQKIEQSELRGV